MKTVTVESMVGAAYAVRIDDGRHEVIADEGIEDGGEDLGPTPYETLLGALGSCMAITMKMYARRKGWPLEGVRVSLSHEKVIAAECEACTPAEIAAAGPRGRIDIIRSSVSLMGDLTEEQRRRVIEIGERCPVHRTLEHPPKLISVQEAAG